MEITEFAEKYKTRSRGHDPISDVRIVDCQFAGVAKDDVIEGMCGLEWQRVTRNGQIKNDRYDCLTPCDSKW